MPLQQRPVHETTFSESLAVLRDPIPVPARDAESPFCTKAGRDAETLKTFHGCTSPLAAIARAQFLDNLLCHLINNVIPLPNCERDNRQRRICRRAGCELAAVRNKQVFAVVSLSRMALS